MAKRYDAIIIGGGHNGLTTAAFLARAGLSVLVLERRHVLGGAAVSEQVFPGFTFSVCSYVVSLLRPEIIRELDLPRHGLEILPMDCSFTPMHGNYLARWADPDQSRREVMRHSRADAEIYPEFSRAMVEMARFVKPILSMTPPEIGRPGIRDVVRLLRLGKSFKDLGEDLMYVKARMMTMSALDFLAQWFESDVLKATMAVSGIIGTFQSISSPGTAYVLLHHYMGEIDGAFRSWGFAKGGTGAVSESIASAARSHGAEVRTQAPVERVLLSGDRAVGVVLEGSGEEIPARIVVSGVDPRVTFLKLVGEKNLDTGFVSDLKRYKFRGSSGKVNLALDGLPDFTCLPGNGPHIRGDVAIAPSTEYLERAYDEAKYGEFSKRPYLNIVIPTLSDPTLAPPGKHILSAFVQYAPYHLKNGTWDQRREEFGDTVIDTIAEFAPNIRDIILHRQVVTPLDLEREFGLTEGNIFHGELSLEQLFFLRPVAGWARYRTPIRDYWMCASGTHPGGGIMGAPGYNAAREILADMRVGS